ncbi:hypothetical protein EYF80_064810 [Liparis tanakae]|uniref:Uncharacterized protein n=1 Tax=Liparis tanakae TaxID=230148 RepID=A0A4Z2E8Q9_9TELE|nr:hypothetical protein EYF80_064810 [Liparis tanakae]
MPDAAAAAATGGTGGGDGAEGSRHRHRAQQGDAERPEPGAAASGVLGEFRCAMRTKEQTGARAAPPGCVLLSPRARPNVPV